MNANEIEKQLLLQHSGELPVDAENELENALRDNPESQAFAEDLNRLTTEWHRMANQTPAHSSQTIAERVHKATTAARSGKVIMFERIPRILSLAAAAIVIIVSSLWVATHLSEPPTPQPINAVAEVPIDEAIETALEAFDIAMFNLLNESLDAEAYLDNDS